MNTRVFSAFNESSKKQLATGIGIVDSVDEPVKVLKILMEGLAPACGSGIWITRFHGLPIARSYAPFDLIYLDDNHRVVHDVEITQTSNFVPFRGLPTSALVLPPKSITSSKTFTGDHIALSAIETATPPAENANGSPRPAQATPPPSSGAPAVASRRLNITFELVQEAPAPVLPSPEGGGVLKPAKRTPSSPPDSETSVIPGAAEDSNAPKILAEPEGVLKRPKKSRSAPASEAENTPPPVVEPGFQALSVPPALDSASPASAADAPDDATPATAAPEREIAISAPAEPISLEPVRSAPEPVSIDLTPDSPIEPVFETSSPVAPLAGIPAQVAPASEALASVETSDAPIETPPIELSQSDEMPAITPPQPAPKDTEISSPELRADNAPVSVDEPVPTESSPVPTPLSDEEALPQVASSDSPETMPQPETRRALDKPQQQKALQIARRWDVKLLYSLFPELHPSYRPELQMPSVDPLKHLKSEDDEKLSAKLQVLSWLYPELELQTLEKRQRSHRRAPRIENPGLVGYFYTSGKAEPCEIRNFSITGFYMKTDERWLPGTVIRITLQMADTDGTNPGDTLTLHSRVVNWDEHGGGFEFVLPGFLQ